MKVYSEFPLLSNTLKFVFLQDLSFCTKYLLSRESGKITIITIYFNSKINRPNLNFL